MAAEDWRDIWEMAISHSPYHRFPVDRQRLVQHWNEVSRDYDSEAMSLIDERIFGLLEGMSVLSGGGSALDIGCGTGSLTSMIAPRFSRVLGVDISPGMLSVAKGRCAGQGNVELLCQSWEEFVPPQRYDLVFSSFCPAVDDLSSVMRMDAMSRGVPRISARMAATSPGVSTTGRREGRLARTTPSTSPVCCPSTSL